MPDAHVNISPVYYGLVAHVNLSPVDNVLAVYLNPACLDVVAHVNLSPVSSGPLCVSAGLPPPVDSLESSGLLSPSSTVRGITRELQHSLDLASATSGEKVVTARVRLETQPPSLTFSFQNPARVSLEAVPF